MNEDSELLTVAGLALMKQEGREFGAMHWSVNRISRRLMKIYAVNLRQGDLPSFVSFSRLFPEQLHCLKELVSPLISRENTNYRDSISPGKRLMITLCFLATGELQSIETEKSINYVTLFL